MVRNMPRQMSEIKARPWLTFFQLRADCRGRIRGVMLRSTMPASRLPTKSGRFSPVERIMEARPWPSSNARFSHSQARNTP